MPFRFRLGGWQLFLLLALIAMVAAMTFGTGMLYGTLLAEKEAANRPPETPPSEEGPASGEPVEPQPTDRNGTPQLIYEVQLSSHLRQADTTPVVEKLLAAGYRAFVVETRDSSNRSLYTVRIGPWSDFVEAAEAADAFRDHSGLEGLDPKIRHRPKPALPGASLATDNGGDAN